MRHLKMKRPNYDRDINLYTIDESANNLFTIYNIESQKLKSKMVKLMCSIANIMVNGRGSNAHDQMNETIEEFWNTKSVLRSENKLVIEIENLILDIYSDCKTIEEDNALVSILRMPEFFYISHEELSNIQNNPLDYISEVSMLSNSKSIFKIPGKTLSLKEIMDINKDYIREQCDTYENGLADKFEDYLKYNRFKSPSVRKYMIEIRSNIIDVLNRVKNDEVLLYSSKVSSAFYRGSKSIIEDNFWRYDSKFFNDEWLDQYIRYPQLPLEGNYDYMRIGFGLGPDYKLRNIVLTNSNLQSLGGVIRLAAKKTFKDFNREGLICPIKTDDQSTDFKNMIDEGTYNQFKICFDLSKYSDYLLSQMTDLILDYLFKNDPEYASVMKKIFNMPINIKGETFDIVFGTGAGIKGNFDCITIANMLMVDFTGYLHDMEIGNIMVVGDDIYVDSNEKDFANKLFITYTHFNCKINKKKSRAIEKNGKVSFCNRHWWFDDEDNIMKPWNGIAPGLWMKQIYSLNRLNAIYSIMKGTNQPINISIMDKLFLLNMENIQREFKINYMKVDLRDTYESMKTVPYQLNGLADGMEMYDGKLQPWVDLVYNQFETYSFMLSNNGKIKDVFAHYYEKFPDHPILSELMITNGTYLTIIHEISEAYKIVKDDPSYENHIRFAKAVRSGTTRFAKMDNDSRRISTKDRTSDFFNEDKFYKPKEYDSVGISEQRLSKMEIDVLKTALPETPTSEMWMMIKNRSDLIRNGWSPWWNAEDTVIMRKEKKGIKIRLYTLDNRSKNGKYEDWDYSWENISFVFDQFYPDNNETLENKRLALSELTRAMRMMRREASLSIMQILDLL